LFAGDPSVLSINKTRPMLRDECQKNDQLLTTDEITHAFVDFLSTAFNKATTNIHYVCLQMQSMFGHVFHCKACELDSH